MNEVAVFNLPSLYMGYQIKIYMRLVEKTRNKLRLVYAASDSKGNDASMLCSRG